MKLTVKVKPRPYTARETDGRGQTPDLIHCVKLMLRGQTPDLIHCVKLMLRGQTPDLTQHVKLMIEVKPPILYNA